jgi:hypothetical protein
MDFYETGKWKRCQITNNNFRGRTSILLVADVIVIKNFARLEFYVTAANKPKPTNCYGITKAILHDRSEPATILACPETCFLQFNVEKSILQTSVSMYQETFHRLAS